MPPSVPVAQSSGAQQPVQRNRSEAASANGSVGVKAKKCSRRKESLNAKASGVTSSSRAEITSESDVVSPQSATIANSTMLGAAGSGMYGGGGMMMGSPYGYSSSYGYGGMMPGGMMPDMAFSGLNQFLFSVQSVIFSLGQAVQIMGMNTQALRQLLDTATAMFDHALSAWKEMRALEVAAHASESDEDKKKRRRLKALRWTMMVGVSYAIFKIIRKFLPASGRRRRDALGNGSHLQLGSYDQGNRSMFHGDPAGAMASGKYYGSNGYGSSYTPLPYGGGGYGYNSSPHGPGSGSYPGYY